MSKSARRSRARNGVLKPTALAAVISTQSNPIDHVASSDSQSANDSVSEPALAFEPPKTRADVSPERLKLVITSLLAEPGLVKGVLFHHLGGSLQERLEKIGCGTVPYLMSVLQEIGLLRWCEKQWYIMDEMFIDELLSPEWVARCEKKVLRHYELVREAQISKQLERKLDEKSINESEPDAALMVQVAGLLEDIEQLKTQNQEQVNTIGELQRKLAEPPKVTSAHVAEYIATLRSGRS